MFIFTWITSLAQVLIFVYLLHQICSSNAISLYKLWHAPSPPSLEIKKEEIQNSVPLICHRKSAAENREPDLCQPDIEDE
jgi:hypothetical protein